MAQHAIREIHHRGADASPRLPVGSTGPDPAEHFDALLNASFDGFVVSDAQGTVLKVNKAYTRISGLREEEIIFQSAEYADLPTFNLVIHSDKMRRCLWSALKAARYDSPVLILGESGVGKGRFARLIHDAGPQRDGPFVHLNCGAIPEPLVESELFGYERGAFTGALTTGKAGQFELAQNGTIFLDEVGELSLNLQVKLLNVIDEKRVQRLGGPHSIAINPRLIPPTNRDLKAMVAGGKFREDLYFRLNVVPLRIPALRERPEDIPVMITTFLESLSRK